VKETVKVQIAKAAQKAAAVINEWINGVMSTVDIHGVTHVVAGFLN
jgi:hypothetical protein